MEQLRPPIIPPQQPNTLLKNLRLPERKMLVLTLPANKRRDNLSALLLRTLILLLRMLDHPILNTLPITAPKKPINQSFLPLRLQITCEFPHIAEETRVWAVESSELDDRRSGQDTWGEGRGRDVEEMYARHERS